jgi:hypothetical protein
MRLSSMKAAHAALAGAAYGKFGYLAFVARGRKITDFEGLSLRVHQHFQELAGNSREFPTSRKEREIWGTRVRGRENS